MPLQRLTAWLTLCAIAVTIAEPSGWLPTFVTAGGAIVVAGACVAGVKLAVEEGEDARWSDDDDCDDGAQSVSSKNALGAAHFGSTSRLH